MQKNRAERPPSGIHACLSLLLIAAVVLSGCGGKDTPTPTKPAAAPPTAVRPTSVPTSAPTAVPTTPPAVSEAVIAIPSGGSIVIPEGALPKDAKVSTTATQMPALPDDVEPVGNAFSITSSAQPTEPVTLRLPIPEGVADTSRLAILRVEADGAATFLMTEVDGQELVAATPGFSTFSVADLLDSKSVVLVGNAALIPGERTTFYPRFETNVNAQGGEWNVSGNFTLVYESATSAIVQAGEAPGYGVLTYEFVDLARGRRWYGSRPLASYSGAAQFKASLITRTPQAYAGEDVLFTASAYGEFEGPITWTWDFGNGTKGEKTTDATVRNLELPLTRYEGPQQGREYRLYAAHLTARDAKNREARDDSSLYVKVRPFQVVLEGPQMLSWKDGGVSAAYTAAASGGQGQIQYTWRLVAGSPSIVPYGKAAEQRFTFPEPGDYRLEVVSADEETAETAAFLPIRVQGGEALSARILDLPATAKPGAKITFRMQIRGGVLVVAGKKSGYTVLVDWRDGSLPNVEKGVGADRTPDQGTVHQMSHGWTEPKTYTVMVLAWDATGRMAGASREITITDAAPTASPTATAKAAPKATATATAAAGLLVWVRQDPAIVNVNKDPLEIQAPEPRFAGSFSKMTPGETSFTTQERYVDHGTEFYNVSITCNFDTPPLVLNPGLRYKVKVSCSSGGSNPGGEQSLGERFWYSAQKGYETIIEPREVINYFPWSKTFDGTSAKEWMIAAPPARRLGDTFQIYAGLWNRAPCNVTWTYKAEYH